MKNLQEVESRRNMTKRLSKTSLVSCGEDFYKFKHVPCVVSEYCGL